MSNLAIRGNNPIIIVDDDPMFQEIMVFALRQSNIKNKILTFESGHDCLSYLNEQLKSQSALPSLILMDFHMPQMNGIETILAIREIKALKTIPVTIMTSTYGDEEQLKSVKIAGATQICEKPFDITKFAITWQD